VVRRGTIEEDLLRRDFTINAMAAAIWPRRWGEILDPTGGLRDLRERRVRPLHERSYLEDPTRLFRALRYRTRLDFHVDPLTSMFLVMDEMREFVDRLSGDRVRHELERSLGGPDAAEQLMWLRGATWLESVLPHVSPLLDSIDGTTDALETLDGTFDSPLRTWLVWLLALVPTGKAAEDASAIIERLALDRPSAEIVQSFVRLLKQKLSPGDTRSLIFKRFDGAPPEALVALAARRWSLLPAVEWFLAAGRHVRPLLNGDDLLAAGFAEGPLIGRILNELRLARLDGKIETVEDEWRLARRLAERQP
ncbi:MAG: CCA tRNA nucleotidyltransferase, partial [Armatimonadetes bacterium]|nr:CCA tRNA nucleotidyltransferase [Armatimonadota bacterium]